jgi:hypothetical protein
VHIIVVRYGLQSVFPFRLQKDLVRDCAAERADALSRQIREAEQTARVSVGPRCRRRTR